MFDVFIGWCVLYKLYKLPENEKIYEHLNELKDLSYILRITFFLKFE